ncbi:MAG: GMC family oxidoreductase [Halioglobus sp.]|nr:GMC family oxidoreductase [Halioglobus sp.]
MRSLTRRQFVQRSSLVAAAATLGSACSDTGSRAGARPRAVVIGSGFGGSVAALRLGQAGISTVVLERGQQWTLAGPDTFPRIGQPDRRTTWFGEVEALTGAAAVTPWAGMLERVAGDTLDAICGACVGGGSLVYGGVLIQPQRELFSQVFPQINYDDMDQVYYPRVIAEIGAARIPDDVLASQNYAAHRAFLEDARAAGFAVQRPHTGFDWDIIRREINGREAAAASVSEYIYGCNSGAKLSTDKNYLWHARATGKVEIRSLTEVVMMRERDSGGYALECRCINAQGDELERYELQADYVFLAAGSLNTSKLLLKSQLAGGLHGGNDRIGQRWGTNGDQLMLEYSSRPVSGPQGGPACVAAIDASDAAYPVTFMHSPARVPVDIQIQLAMSVPDASGEVVYDADSGRSMIRWPRDVDTPAARARVDSFNRLLTQTGGTSLDGLAGRPTVWHPLGGAVMGDACDHIGQLYGYRNLFVVDGSLLPGTAAAANPSLTIAANAERIMEQLVPRLVRR